MKFSEFRQYRPKIFPNVFVFVCEDDFLVEESRGVWEAMLPGTWVFEKMQVKEFEQIEPSRLMEEALTPSLFSQSRVLLIAGAEKLSKKRAVDLAALMDITDPSLKVILICTGLKGLDALKGFPSVVIDPLKPAEVAKWLMERYQVPADVARYIVETAGMELYALHNEMLKLQTYVGDGRGIEIRDVDASILRSEQFGPFELDDAIMARDYRKSVHVVAAMLEEGVEIPLILARVIRVWRQLFVGKGLVGKGDSRELAMAAGAPAFKGPQLAAACRKYDWMRLARGFREVLQADRAFKTSSPNPEAYLDILLWKLVGQPPDRPA